MFNGSPTRIEEMLADAGASQAGDAAAGAEGAMIARLRRAALYLLPIAMLAPMPDALSQTRDLQGAWLDGDLACASVFASTRNGIGFKRPANAFIPAFIITGRRLSTSLATCRIVKVLATSDRQTLTLHCTTSITSDTARAILAPAPDGGLHRYFASDGSIAATYKRCTLQDLTTADRSRGTDQQISLGRAP
ncbi:hypothetical protein ACWIGM_30745 [Bosea sp. NPDC055332]